MKRPVDTCTLSMQQRSVHSFVNDMVENINGYIVFHL